jgi:hypothetical protein
LREGGTGESIGKSEDLPRNGRDVIFLGEVRVESSVVTMPTFKNVLRCKSVLVAA